MSSEQKSEIITKAFNAMKDIWKKINAQVVLLLLGFILTAIVGNMINTTFQKSSWEREKKFNILSHKLEEANPFVEDLSKLMNERLYYSRRLIWNRLNKEKFNELWEEYFKIVTDWNRNLNNNKIRIERLAGKETAALLTGLSQEEESSNVPRSIHDRFSLANEDLLKVRKWVKTDSCKYKETEIAKFKKSLDTLDNMIYALIDTLDNKIQELEEEQLNP